MGPDVRASDLMAALAAQVATSVCFWLTDCIIPVDGKRRDDILWSILPVKNNENKWSQ